MSQAEPDLSDAGWAGTVACTAVLYALRHAARNLTAREQRALASPEAALCHALWKRSPSGALRYRALRRWVQGANVLVLGGALSSIVLCVAAHSGAAARRAAAAAGAVAVLTWLGLGLPTWRRWRREDAAERAAPRPPPRSAGPPIGNVEDRARSGGLLPVTVITGFLGAGKSTLLRRILREEHGLRMLVIENELGEESIDHELIVQGGKEEIILLRNGCLCCAVRGDLRATLLGVLPRVGQLDGILIETTGVARPAPVVQTLLFEPRLREAMRLDAVITLVDCAHALRQLRAAEPGGGGAGGGGGGGGGGAASGSHEAAWAEQVVFADRVLLNKTDLVPRETRAAVAAAVGAINPGASLIECERADAPIAELLRIHSFDASADALERHPLLREGAAADAAAEPAGEAADHAAGRAGGEPIIDFGAPASRRVGTESIVLSGELDETKFNRWVGSLLQVRAAQCNHRVLRSTTHLGSTCHHRRREARSCCA